MIWIQNISEENNIKYGEGKQIYKLCINKIELCRFEHNFEDGLSECLRKAAVAFEKNKN